VQKGLADPILASAKDFMVDVPGSPEEKKLVDCSQWECLNLDMSTILSMPQKVSFYTFKNNKQH